MGRAQVAVTLRVLDTVDELVRGEGYARLHVATYGPDTVDVYTERGTRLTVTINEGEIDDLFSALREKYVVFMIGEPIKDPSGRTLEANYEVRPKEALGVPHFKPGLHS